MKRFVLLLLLPLVFATTYAQKPFKVKIKKQDFITTPGDDANLAWKELRKGTHLFRQNMHGSYMMAVEHLLKAYKYNPDYAPLNYELGVSYLKIADPINGKKYINNAFDLNPNVAPDIHLWMGRAYHLNSDFSDAIDEYTIYLDGLDSTKNKKQYQLVKHFIQQCKNGIELTKSKNKINAIITNMGKGVNTKYDEYAPVFAPYAHDSIVFFTSNRPGLSKRRNNLISNDYYEDIYYTSFKNGRWHQPALFPKPVNSRGNDASIAINPTGNEIIIRRGIGKGTFFISHKKSNGKWSRPKKLIKRINRNGSFETTLTFSRDSNTVYFVSDRPGGYGGKDIWVTHRSEVWGWTKPKNLGPVINTPYDEEAVFIADNDSVLYFASKGHNSMGGYDIFRSYKLPDGRWSKPENLGPAINTPLNDLFIYISPDGRTGYFTSQGHHSYGGYDIFEFFFYTPKPLFTAPSKPQLLAYFAKPVNEITLYPPVKIKTLRLTVVKGKVTEYGTGRPLNATIVITDNQTRKVVQTIQTNATTGEYMVMLPSGKNYGMAVTAPGHLFYSANFNIPPATGYQEIHMDVQLMPMNIGSKVVLRNVFFDFNSAKLKPSSYPELDRLADILKKYPGIVVEIAGYTDNVGSFKYNLKLSQRRADAVVKYLISKGVPPSALVAKGYGPLNPIASNATEEGRALNRRVEAKILKNPYAPGNQTGTDTLKVITPSSQSGNQH